jgi:alpha-beta hydrolase superfamily lysophospholipase
MAGTSLDLKAPTPCYFFHDDAGNISDRLESIRIFHELGLSVLIIDYRGYGKSEGYANEDGTYIHAETAWHYLIEEKGFSVDDIVIFGCSLGGGIATWLARHRTPAALILESTFISIPAMAAEIYPYFPTKLLSRIQYANIDRVALIDTLILVMHIPDDDLIPY